MKFPAWLPTKWKFILGNNLAIASPSAWFFPGVHNPILTTSIDYANYVGNLTIQGSTLVDADYYDIGNVYQYGNAANGAVESNTIGYTINGYHPYIRLKFEANVGNIVTILAR